MTKRFTKNPNYLKFIKDVKEHIQSSQIKAALSVNKELILLYWYMGQKIAAEQEKAVWGDGFLQEMSKDLTESFPDMKGLSLRNLKYVRQWFLFWNADNAIGQQVVAQLTQIPWGHNLVILSKSQNQKEALFYIQKTIENNWSRSVLTHQIESQLYARAGKAITNFKNKLPKPQSDLALQITKDPYNFDFLQIREKHDELELENALVSQMTKFLLELGAGFSFVGRQYKLTIDEEDFFIDLLFYHIKLRCYVVVELKTVKFKPEFAGKLNFYISAVDDILKEKQDKPTIGILICKSKKDTVVEYSLKDIKKPIGISEYNITQVLPENYKSSLPTIEEIEEELK
ncbi:MAG: PDDEXK nuclease domain-containing protein [Endomicrobium sp.]|jgi:predicted nuclease of restriction endonuclease-like (RecB) superfamily|nr:PDDEXK nuclease domain-containing protein [Endomicrobium sp.]